MITVVHADDILAVGSNSKGDQLCEDLNMLAPINNLGKLRWYAGCLFVRILDADTLTISQLRVR